MLAAMDPALHEGLYAFAAFDRGTDLAGLLPHALAIFREVEGVSLLLPLALARTPDGSSPLALSWIELRVHSALDGVGLTAAVSTRLAEHGIACNVVAAFRHDHILVPVAHAERALALLQALAAENA